MSRFIINPYAFGAAGVSVNYNGHVDTGTTTDAQSTSISFGTAPGAGETRLVVISGCTTGITNVGSAVIGGVSATIIGPAIEGSSAVFLAYAEVNTGTSGTVSFSWTGGPAVDTGISCWSIYNVNATPFATKTDNTTDPSNLGLNVPANGVVLAAEFVVNGSTITFNGLAIKDFEVDISGSNERHAGAHELFTSAQTPLALTVSNAGTPDDNVGVSASWGP